MLTRVRRDRVPYDQWVDEGLMFPTEGRSADYDQIRQQIMQLAEEFDIREIAYDRWNATQLVTQLTSDGANMFPLGQGFANMSAPAKELEKLILSGSIRHGANPVLRWMANNVAVEQDAAGNLKPSKAKSTEKIDGIVALIMAIDRATRQTTSPQSIYETQELTVF